MSKKSGQKADHLTSSDGKGRKKEKVSLLLGEEGEGMGGRDAFIKFNSSWGKKGRKGE